MNSGHRVLRREDVGNLLRMQISGPWTAISDSNAYKSAFNNVSRTLHPTETESTFSKTTWKFTKINFQMIEAILHFLNKMKLN